jgi:hypothetical protein
MGQRRITETFVGTTEAGEMLGIPAPNVWKTLKARGVPHQMLTVGRREMKVFLRDDVERVRRERAKETRETRQKASA